MFEIIDFIQRKINSFLFRFLLLAYSLAIVLSHNNLFDNYIYIIGFVLYYIFYFFLLNYSKLRLVNDFAFITFVIIGKNPNEAFLFIFILLPVINSINFSGRKKSSLLYLVTAIVYFGLVCLYSKTIEIELVYKSLLPLSSLVFLWFIDLYTSLRFKIRNFRESLNEVVDSFYTNRKLPHKPHKVYSRLINLINERIRKDLIQNLYCFTVFPATSDEFVIVNSSKFTWRYYFKEEGILEKIRKKKYQLNLRIFIEGKEYPNNLAVYINVEETEFIFVFTTNMTIPLYYVLIGFFRTLVPALSKMANILLSEKYLQEIKNEELQKLSIRSQYVTRATKAMHFIRNRLGPLNNLMKMFDNIENVTESKKDHFHSLLLAEKNRAKLEVQNIINRADYLLEKSNNPFNFTKTIPISIQKLFTILRRNANVYFSNVDINITLEEHIEKSFVQINEEGFELFLSDWLNNIKKYYIEAVIVNFIISQDQVTIEFLNDIKNDDESIEDLIAEIKSNDRKEIMKRTTHGLFLIKNSLEEMNIKYDCQRVDDGKAYVKFTIALKIIRNENSDI